MAALPSVAKGLLSKGRPAAGSSRRETPRGRAGVSLARFPYVPRHDTRTHTFLIEYRYQPGTSTGRILLVPVSVLFLVRVPLEPYHEVLFKLQRHREGPADANGGPQTPRTPLPAPSSLGSVAAHTQNADRDRAKQVSRRRSPANMHHRRRPRPEQRPRAQNTPGGPAPGLLGCSGPGGQKQPGPRHLDQPGPHTRGPQVYPTASHVSAKQNAKLGGDIGKSDHARTSDSVKSRLV